MELHLDYNSHESTIRTYFSQLFSCLNPPPPSELENAVAFCFTDRALGKSPGIDMSQNDRHMNPEEAPATNPTGIELQTPQKPTFMSRKIFSAQSSRW